MGKDQTVETKSEPWGMTHGYLAGNLREMDRLYYGGKAAVDPYKGPRVAPMSAQTQEGIADMGGIELPPSALIALESNLNMDDTYRDFDRIKGTVADDVKTNLASTFAGGAINSGLAGDTYTRAMTDALAGVEYGAYSDAKNRQLQAAGMAPAYQSAAMDAARAKLAGGQVLDAHKQAVIDAAMTRHSESERADWDALEKYSAMARGIGGMGGYGTQTEPSNSNVFAAGAGGLGAYGLLAANPVTAPFALAGGLMAGLGSLF